ncbi:uncharacterized protein LOC123308209 [Coccinella septempunctata]|uniref:uncharacterized protein LOC123308209 n=1 Tax=Coccinella septempunctata TaxID=41139 RepID=UPI001D06740F|nr:uncharacterized protein LOC123308209 [Coccinella septempunctata]
MMEMRKNSLSGDEFIRLPEEENKNFPGDEDHGFLGEEDDSYPGEDVGFPGEEDEEEENCSPEYENESFPSKVRRRATSRRLPEDDYNTRTTKVDEERRTRSQNFPETPRAFQESYGRTRLKKSLPEDGYNSLVGEETTSSPEGKNNSLSLDNHYDHDQHSRRKELQKTDEFHVDAKDF